MRFDEAKIQYGLHEYLIKKGHEYVIPNVSWSWLYWEADIISITKSFYMYEFEVKDRLAEFKNDFKKIKHYDLKRGKESARLPSYFSYVAPESAVPLCLPDYAGLIIVCMEGRYGHELSFEEIKKPTKIHGLKQTESSVNKMLRTLMWKYWGLANALNQNKIQRELFDGQKEE